MGHTIYNLLKNKISLNVWIPFYLYNFNFYLTNQWLMTSNRPICYHFRGLLIIFRGLLLRYYRNVISVRRVCVRLLLRTLLLILNAVKLNLILENSYEYRAKKIHIPLWNIPPILWVQTETVGFVTTWFLKFINFNYYNMKLFLK